MTAKVILIALGAVLACAGQIGTRLRNKKIIGNQLPDFLLSEPYRCQFEGKPIDEDNPGFAPWKKYRVSCQGLEPEKFEFVECEENCVDPVKKRRNMKKKYQPQQVHISKIFVDVQRRNTTELTHTIACKCVKKKLRKSRRKQNGGKRKNKKQNRNRQNA